MTTCNCSCAAAAWKAGYEAGAASLPATPAELAQQIAEALGSRIGHAGQGRPLLTVNQTAERLNISRGKLYELLRRGELKSIQIGSRTGKTQSRRFEPSEVDAYIEQHRADVGAECPDRRVGYRA